MRHLGPFLFIVGVAGTVTQPGTHPAGTAGQRGARVVTITMSHDSTGQHFRPSEIDAATGDTLRFVAGAGRHNVDFVRDSNPRGVTLPATTQFVERPGETITIPVTLGPGRYFFQCDPHAAMGMVGHLTVRDGV